MKTLSTHKNVVAALCEPCLLRGQVSLTSPLCVPPVRCEISAEMVACQGDFWGRGRGFHEGGGTFGSLCEYGKSS